MSASTFEWKKAPQLSAVQFLLATFVPSGVAFIGFHVVVPTLARNGLPVLVAWSAVACVMLMAFSVVAIVLLRREAKQLGISLWSRMCLTNPRWRLWLIAGGIAVGSIVLSMIAGLLVGPMTRAVGFEIPDYMPFFLNPEIDPMKTDMAALSPGFPLQGRFILLLLVGVTLFFNILTEELYFRAWMLPKLSRYGSWAWVINGVLFALYHTFQLWLLPLLLVGSLGFALVCHISRSIWPAAAAHLIFNILTLALMLMLILGAS